MSRTRHIVMFRLHGDEALRQRVAEEFAQALRALPEQIDCLESMEVGVNVNPAEEWDVVLTATVSGGLEAVNAYAVHPAHVAAAAIVGPHKAARACVDYPC